MARYSIKSLARKSQQKASMAEMNRFLIFALIVILIINSFEEKKLTFNKKPMNFKISVTETLYKMEDEKLKELGFTFKRSPPRWEAMGRFEIGKEEPTVMINTLEGLLQFVDKYGKIVLEIEHGEK